VAVLDDFPLVDPFCSSFCLFFSLLPIFWAHLSLFIGICDREQIANQWKSSAFRGIESSSEQPLNIRFCELSKTAESQRLAVDP
jgi:hypothetical protein